MVENAHNVASEFARVVRASGPRNHVESLAGKMYNTTFELAVRALSLEKFERPLIRNWRRGRAAPRDWAIQIVAEELERCGDWYYSIARKIRQAGGPGHGGQVGTEALRRWRARQRELGA